MIVQEYLDVCTRKLSGDLVNGETREARTLQRPSASNEKGLGNAELIAELPVSCHSECAEIQNLIFEDRRHRSD